MGKGDNPKKLNLGFWQNYHLYSDILTSVWLFVLFGVLCFADTLFKLLIFLGK